MCGKKTFCQILIFYFQFLVLLELMLLKMWVHRFLTCILSDIFIGSVHVKGDYLRLMLTTVAMDGYHQTTPIEFCLSMILDV